MAAVHLLQNRTALLAFGILVVISIASLWGPCLLPANCAYPGHSELQPPSLRHPFGTDLNGRDVLYRTLQGGRISLAVGISGATISLLVGCFVGLIAGYSGGNTDAMLMRLVDILYSVPRLIFILVFISLFSEYLKKFASSYGWQWMIDSSRILILIGSLGFIEWLTMARIVRGQVLPLKEQAFIQAARALGQSTRRILTLHLWPNLMPIVVVNLTLTIPAVIIDESFLSFLGLGIQSPMTSWGAQLSEGANALNPVHIHWWLIAFPGLALALTLLALNFLGDSLRDLLNPRFTNSNQRS